MRRKAVGPGLDLKVRVPPHIALQIRKAAEENGRTLNGEIAVRLMASFTDAPVRALDAIARDMERFWKLISRFVVDREGNQ